MRFAVGHATLYARARPVQGCDYVIHTASPYINGVPKAEVRQRLIEPAVKGTENVLGGYVGLWSRRQSVIAFLQCSCCPKETCL